jgi:hypothetical protein
MPVLAAALYSFVAVGATAAAGSVYGYVTLFVASVHVALASHASAGAEVTVVAEVESVCGDPPPVVNVVDVAVMFQPVPEPDASPTSSACVAFTVWSRPFSVAEKLTFGGVDTKPSEPAAIVAVPVDATDGTANTAAAVNAATSNSRTRGFDLPDIRLPYFLEVIESPS